MTLLFDAASLDSREGESISVPSRSSRGRAFAYLLDGRIFSDDDSSGGLFFACSSRANESAKFRFSLNCDTRGSSVLRGRAIAWREGGGGRLGRACCIFYIPLTFAPDTVRSLVLSECRQKVWRFRGDRQDRRGGRGTRRVGSQVLYFLRGGYGRGVARFVRHADRSGAGHLLTRDSPPPLLPRP